MNVVNVFEVVPKGYERYNICCRYFDEPNKCRWIFSSRRRKLMLNNPKYKIVIKRYLLKI